MKAQFVLALVLTLTPPSFAASIYKVDPWIDGSLIVAGTLVATLSDANAERFVTPRCPCDPNELNAWDRSLIGNNNEFFDHFSDYKVAAAVVFPIVLDWLEVGWTKDFAEDMAVYAESLSASQTLVTVVKYSAQRPRPLTYAGDTHELSSPDGYLSFYSGHTTTAFTVLTTAAVTHSLRHPEDRWPWYLAALGGTSVAYDRILSGKHFYTDVIAGAAAGTAVGFLVPWLHRRTGTANQSVAIMPVDGGAFVLWKNRF